VAFAGPGPQAIGVFGVAAEQVEQVAEQAWVAGHINKVRFGYGQRDGVRCSLAPPPYQ